MTKIKVLSLSSICVFLAKQFIPNVTTLNCLTLWRIKPKDQNQIDLSTVEHCDSSHFSSSLRLQLLLLLLLLLQNSEKNMGFSSFLGRVLFASLFILSAWQMSVLSLSLSLSLDPFVYFYFIFSSWRSDYFPVELFVFLHLGFSFVFVFSLRDT